MDPKVIIYLIVAVIYFLYTIGKKAEEKKKNASQKAGDNPSPKPVTPPSAFEEVKREIKRRQIEAELKKKMDTAQPKKEQPVQRPKEILIQEKRSARMGDGYDSSPVYEREVTAEEKIQRGNIFIKDEGIYKISDMEEAKAADEEVMESNFQFDARQAFIGSVILERKY